METIKKINIFVVDDNRMLTEAVCELITANYSAGIVEAFSFTSGEDCLKELDRLKPEIVILDYYLNSENNNVANGVEICRLIKKSHESVYVVFLSGQNKINVAIEAVREGAYDYVIKDNNAFDNISQILSYLIFKIRHKND